MTHVFADTLYWVAIARPNDSWTMAARSARGSLGKVVLVTTDEVLTEFLAPLSKGGPLVRNIAVQMVREILHDPEVQVVPQTREGFLRGLDRFEQREDKSYSLTDCISMTVMNSRAAQLLRMQSILTRRASEERRCKPVARRCLPLLGLRASVSRAPMSN